MGRGPKDGVIRFLLGDSNLIFVIAGSSWPAELYRLMFLGLFWGLELSPVA